MKITGRSSSITNSFINSIIPVIEPTNDEVKHALDILEMDHYSFQCSYCGTVATEWDHLRPLVMNKKPTGYVSEIHNLVPACGKCNQSKGNKDWRVWMISDAALSPKTKGVSDIQKRMERLERYENNEVPTKVDFESLVGKEKWEQHWKNWEVVQETMRNAQVLATEINETVAKSYTQL
ncbi:HNH endonuclease [Moritella sp. Urea-trap-13]|nr:HNH endonuclease [Moritella sp. Urea-trap-13]